MRNIRVSVVAGQPSPPAGVVSGFMRALPWPRAGHRVRPLWRPRMTPLALNMAVAGYLLASCNTGFWRHFLQASGGQASLLLAGGLVAWLLLVLLASVAGLGRAQRPALALLVLLAAAPAFYVDSYGIVVDREMVQNVMVTTTSEARHLLTPDAIACFLLRAIPGWGLVYWPLIRRHKPLPGCLRWAGTNLLIMLLVVGVVMLSPALQGMARNNRNLIHILLPWAPVSAGISYAHATLQAGSATPAPLGRDAVRGSFLATARKPVVLVVVAGETSRAANWSLGSYGRNTNPELAKRELAYFPDVASCGTSTAVSLPCMFSYLPRRDYSERKGRGLENLLDVLGHAGLHVEWWDNNTGDKGIAARFTRRDMTAADDPAACSQGECTDEVFLRPLQAFLDAADRDTVLVLHQIGSHGPSYWLRYPPEREVFRPACHSAELARCTREDILIYYDNTIVETDWVLARIIDMLAASRNLDGSLVYVSDHGESLGENGLYLHGAPYVMAPAEQKRVPMLIWLSDGFSRSMALDTTCLEAGDGGPPSHDHLFASVLGLLDIRTTAREASLDLTTGCRQSLISASTAGTGGKRAAQGHGPG
ncbi:MAG: sulfatase-like hydrolase/transferase [Gammaproteobacteria bacterium]|nr:sulfatase-like hydrolase/transferase [Gammaproteobacteria bacterium]